MTTVGVVVTNYRTPHDLDRFITSLQAFDSDRRTCLAVVNVDPGDADFGVVSKHGDFVHRGGLHVMDNIGYGRACNRGAEEVFRDFDVDYVMLCNADIEWTAGALDDMVRAMDRDCRWGVLGPRQVDDVGRIVHAGIFGTRDRPRHRGWKQLDRGQYTDVLPAVTVSGSAYLVRRKCWDELSSCPRYRQALSGLDLAGLSGAYGAFLPTPFYYEETWCSYHAVEHGWAVMYYGASTLVHRWHNSVKTNNAERWAADQMVLSQRLFRQVCGAHRIPCD